jgi:hypothetical protein
MSANQEYILKQKVRSVLSAIKWKCRICETIVETSTNATDDEKDSILRAHLNETHLGSPLYNKDGRDEYKVLYFKVIDEKIQDNIKFQ